jgi:flagellar hook-length control protein FliK
MQPGTHTSTAAPVPGAVPLPQAQPAADTVKLAGPPTAWRQSLQETLGDRLNVHVANNVQQATISIEPPQLGRIDIAIRHSAGTLEVNISATNGDVLRQLQTVSDNLRNDLSQRQYTEVAVTVTPAPRNNAAPFGDPQQQGRGRQQGRDQDNEPGRGLAEAGNPASVFNLGRDS